MILCEKYKVEPQILGKLSLQKLVTLTAISHTAEYISFSEVLTLTAPEIKTYCSHDCRIGYKAKAYTFQDLRQIGIKKCNLLISSDALRIYQETDLALTDFAYLSLENIGCLIKDGILIEAYKLGVKPRDIVDSSEEAILRNVLSKVIDHFALDMQGKEKSLGHIDTKIMITLINSKMIELYKSNTIRIDQLTALLQDEIEFLTSDPVTNALTHPNVQASDIIGLSKEEAQFLISPGALDLYSKYGVTVSGLKGTSSDVANKLISPEAKRAYGTKMVSVADLKKYSTTEIDLFLSQEYIQFYKAEIKFDNVRGFESEKVSLLTLMQSISGCISDKTPLKYLAVLEVQTLEKLASKEAQKCYATGDITPQNIEKASLDVMKAISDWNATSAYRIGYVQPSDLVPLPVERINKLLSSEAKQFCKNYNITGSDLCKWDKEKIDFFLSKNQEYAFQTVSPLALVDFDLEKCKAITATPAIQALRNKIVTVEEFAHFSSSIIPKLVTKKALKAYKEAWITIKDLMASDVREDNIDLLFSSSASLAYNMQIITPAKLSKLSREKILEQLDFSHLMNIILPSYEPSQHFVEEEAPAVDLEFVGGAAAYGTAS